MHCFDCTDYKFIRHNVSIGIGRILRAVRASDSVRKTDRIIIEAVLEVMDDIRSYGPFEIDVKERSTSSTIVLYYDHLLVLSFDLNKQNEARLNFLRSGDMTWFSEFCKLANAHVELVSE